MSLSFLKINDRRKSIKDMKTRIFIADVIPLHQPAKLNAYLEKISKERREKIARLQKIDAKALSAGAEMLLQKAIKECCGISDGLIIVKNEGGKPVLKDYPDIHFNLSHSGHYAVCALSSHPVGVDIQKIERINLKVAKRFFAEAESAWLFALPEALQEQAFGDLWSIKESYMKYTGKGFGLPLHTFTVKIGEGYPAEMTVAITAGNEKKNITVKKYHGPENYVLWSCSGENQFAETVEWIEL